MGRNGDSRSRHNQPRSARTRWWGRALLGVILPCAAVAAVACSSSDDADSAGQDFSTSCNAPVGGVRLAPAFSALKFSIPTTLVLTPDHTQYFVTEKAGVIKRFANDDNVKQADTVLDIRDRVNSGDREPGVNGLALHPRWPSVPEAYVTYNGALAGGAGYSWRLSRFVSKDGGKTLDPQSETVLITGNKPASEHNGGQMNFHPTEVGKTGVPLLYISVGDSEAAKGPLGNAQNTNAIFGKFLRIDILDETTRAAHADANGKPSRIEYDAPEDNPFNVKGDFPPIANGSATTPRGLKEVYSWGHRNPWRWNFDQHDGKVDIWSAEVGQESFEELDLVKKGHNYGWNFKEGLHTQTFCKEFGNCVGKPLGICKAADGDSCVDGLNLTEPLVEVPHRADPNDPLTKNASGYLAQSVTGGFVYRGQNPAMSSLVGVYVYADFQNGSLYAAVPSEKMPNNARSSAKFTPLKIGSGEMITSFQKDDKGEILALGFHGGIYRLTGGSCPSLPDPNARTYVFLSKQGILNFREGMEYLISANPDVPALAKFSLPGDFQSPKNGDLGTTNAKIGPDFTLAQWKQQFMVGDKVAALYKNDLDLGFWRQLECTKTIGRGVGGCWVTNWPATSVTADPTKGQDVVPDPNALTEDKPNLGTVTMNISPDGFTRFYIFGVNPPHKVQPFAVLDGEGEKVSPALCTPCHGGTYAGSPDLGSIFRELEPSALRRHPTVSQDVAEQQWFALNQAMKTANKSLKGSATEPLANGIPATQSVLDYIESMYPTGAPPALPSRDLRHIPKTFLDNADGVTPQYKQAKQDLYTKLVGPYCSSCHRYNNTDLNKYDFVQNLAVPSGTDVLLHQLIATTPDDPQRLKLPQMPQSAFQQFRLLQDNDALGTINAWVAQVTDPNFPQCEVTFTVTTDINRPAFDPGNEALRILGQTTPPKGTGALGRPDPLSNWKATDPGLDLGQTDSDAQGHFRFTGHASFPQGANIEFKAVVGKNESVRFERLGGPNRQFTVPNQTTTAVEFFWEN